MSQDPRQRLNFITQLVENLKKIESEQHVTIEHLAKLQMEVQETGKENLAEKIGQVFANASKNTELLHEMVDAYTIEINQLKQSL